MTPALVIDLDGTLLKSDSLWEAVVHMLATRPWLIFAMPFWLLKGKAFLKVKTTPYAAGYAADWPYNREVVKLAKKAKAEGRRVCLATAANISIAREVAEYHGLFDTVLASDDERNLKGGAKLLLLKQTFGDGEFDYIGDSASDLPVFAACRQAFLVGSRDSSLSRKAAAANPSLQIISTVQPGLRSFIKAIRMRQWVKNIIIFIPLVLSHDFAWTRVLASISAFATFSFGSSCVYVINDLVDLPFDRRSQKKRKRPFAAGDLPLWWGFILAVALFSLMLLSLWSLPLIFKKTVAIYFILNALYSFYLKRVIILDVIVLTGFYVIRLIAGATAMDSELTNWLLGFGCFIFFGLGIVKRAGELRAAKKNKCRATGRAGEPKNILGRSYYPGDCQILETMAVASGFSAVTVFALYIDTLKASTLYSQLQYLWALCPLMMYWYGRILLIAHRGDLLADPVEFVVTDRTSLYCGLIGLVIFVIAI